MILSVQVLRFVAAAMIVLLHAAQTAVTATGSTGLIPHDLMGMSQAGVDVFFVISGLVIAKTAPKLTAAQFAWRRLRRILPIYWLCCIPAVIVARDFGWRDVLGTFALWPATDVMTPSMLRVAWTLSFEMLFYACVTFVLLRPAMLWPMLAVYLGLIAFRPAGPIFQFLGNPLIIEFLFGVLLARTSSMRYGLPCLLLGFGLLIASAFAGFTPQGETADLLAGTGGLQRVIVVGIPAALVVFGAMNLTANESIWTRLGEASYAIYLTHVFILTGLQALWLAFPIRPEAIILISAIPAILFGWRVHELVEKPILVRLPRAI